VSTICPVRGGSLELDRQLCFALYATSRAMTQAYGPVLAPLGVTYPQYLVLLVLWEADDLTVSGIGARLFLDSGTLTPLLKRLEAQGIVRRRRDAVDERAVRVSLTPAGKRLRQRAEGVARDVACALGIEPAEIALIREPLRALLLRFHSSKRHVPEPKSAPRAGKKKPS
jgi:DNA-binding MarR family transcriptional regulator